MLRMNVYRVGSCLRGSDKLWVIKMKKQQGFTLLELLITVSIIGAVFVVASSSGMDGWNKKRTAQNTYKELVDTLATLKNTAISRNTSSRIVITQTSGTYTMTTYTSAAPTTDCSSAAAWTTLATKTLEVHSTYQITGSGMTDMCFYRDGSSFGGQFVIAPTSGTGTTYTITIEIATGFIDVSES